MKVLVIGSGGREHAMAWKVAQSNKVDTVYCAPGNGGTYYEAKCRNINIRDTEELVKFAKENNISLTIVGPEEPLINGIVDAFKREGLEIFGPSKRAAMLEGSKIFAKDFMRKYGVKTAEYASFDNIDEAMKYIKKCSYPIVVKADGIAAGKGVVICSNYSEASNTLEGFMIADIFNGAGKKIVIEEFLEGVEASILSITDGKCIVPFISAKDHKQIYDGNIGPNTGGMGAISPNPYCTEEVLEEFVTNILTPTLNGIVKEAFDFTGIIFFGIMITVKGVYLLEYNVRMGDPETQAVLSLMESDFFELILCALKGRLSGFPLRWKSGNSCCIVAASGGYPDRYSRGYEINITEAPNSKVFIAGAESCNEVIKTSGGRVLSVVSVEQSLEIAIEKAYEGMKNINFTDMYYRRDIGSL